MIDEKIAAAYAIIADVDINDTQTPMVARVAAALRNIMEPEAGPRDWIALADAVDDKLSGRLDKLVKRANALVDMIEDAENNHGGLLGKQTLRCKNELRLEMERWK